MQEPSYPIPIVLVIGGHDPSGGAGIQADIEAVAANGAHAVSVITTLTVQDSCDVQALHPVPAETIAAQANALFADSPIAAIKIGLLGSPEAAKTVVDLLATHRNIPVVLDPVLAAGGGSRLAGDRILALLREMLPMCDLITPNTHEAHRLCDSDDSDAMEACAKQLQALGAQSVLITGTHERVEDPQITHRLFLSEGSVSSSQCQRLPGEYHGSGCTLASAIAARLAHGEPVQKAVANGLDYSWQSLSHGFRTGRCQSLPDRLYSLQRRDSDEDE
ncbi:MAG: hydroxymethylpyrimidine/phosphomethylpyrimidine kinase [Candidatus Thiodiazotropha sp. (ex Monitilora ramsayi)]|nr:hydroxymethylpyrimidine/phosphomethylpyrimidine kinase [Candidatus Thiodiazotropha sp. (ex Monitilora ramsayi)]